MDAKNLLTKAEQDVPRFPAVDHRRPTPLRLHRGGRRGESTDEATYLGVLFALVYCILFRAKNG